LRYPAPFESLTIVGIARNTDVSSFGSRDGGVVYAPLSEAKQPLELSVVARGDADPRAMAKALRVIAGRADPNLVIRTAGPGRLVLAGARQIVRYVGLLAALLGLSTLVLSSIGLHGILTHAVVSRTHEIGVRLALGATPSRVTRFVLADGFRPAGIGLLLGYGMVAVGSLVTRLLLDEPIVLDVRTVLAVGAVLVSGALLASFIPARRAARLQPTEALREL